ncbi:MAG: D-alanyl-D-alanine carboxypeptidase family protein, partial [Candidatus Levyibacteriota bacterium]
MKDYLSFFRKKEKQSKKFLVKHTEYLLPTGIVAIVILLLIAIQFFSWQAKNDTVFPEPLSSPKVALYPLIERNFLPQISAQAAFVMDNDSKVVLFAKNENFRFSPASTTKIMTALTALDEFNLSDVLTVKEGNIEGSVVGLVKGERMTFENLLLAMLLPSGNDAATAIADNDIGGKEAFVKKMNAKAKFLDLTNTHFGDPAGLLDDEDYTTAHDLAFLASYAITHPTLAKIFDTKKTTITNVEGTIVYPIENLNKLLGIYGVDGVKTGYTDEAGEVLVTSTVQQGHTFIIVVMKSDDRFGDTEKLLKLIADNTT